MGDALESGGSLHRKQPRGACRRDPRTVLSESSGCSGSSCFSSLSSDSDVAVDVTLNVTVRRRRMTTKRRLITDSYRVVKRERRGGKRERTPTPPPTPQQLEAVARLKDLQKLQQFDLDWRFGPCTGISRLQRWERAQFHGLQPPQEIRELLLQTDQNDPELRESLWREYPL